MAQSASSPAGITPILHILQAGFASQIALNILPGSAGELCQVVENLGRIGVLRSQLRFADF